jgi:hypothetical protein
MISAKATDDSLVYLRWNREKVFFFLLVSEARFLRRKSVFRISQSLMAVSDCEFICGRMYFGRLNRNYSLSYYILRFGNAVSQWKSTAYNLSC